MTDTKNKKGLGKGLSALLPGIENDKKAVAGEQVLKLAPSELYANPEQPRKSFDEEKLAELASSVAEHGVVQPLIVVRGKEGKYMIVAGERRYRAALLAKVPELPCVLRELDETQIREMALIENIQREDLNAWEEAESFRALQEQVGYTQEQLAQRLGKSRPYIANTLRLLSLDEHCAALLREGKLSAGHARALLAVESEYNRKALAGRIVREQLSVRETEELARSFGKLDAKKKKQKPKPKKNAYFGAIEQQLRYRFGTKVSIEAGEKGGRLVMDYYSEEDLTRLVELLLPDTEF